jgi:hypothetical protein
MIWDAFRSVCRQRAEADGGDQDTMKYKLFQPIFWRPRQRPAVAVISITSAVKQTLKAPLTTKGYFRGCQTPWGGDHRSSITKRPRVLATPTAQTKTKPLTRVLSHGQGFPARTNRIASIDI